MYLLVLREVNNRPQEVEQSLVAFEALKQIDQSFGGKLFMVLGGDLNADLEVLSDVGSQHSL